MRTVRVVLAAAVATVVVSVGAVACGGDSTAEINQTFKGYYTALLARDFPTACGYTAPESTQRLLSTLATQGVQASTCEDALAAVFNEPGAADISDTIARTAKVNDIQVDGDQATVKWSSTLDGQQQDGTYGMHRIDGQWKLVAVS
jgi:hypothetical protein